MPRRFLRILPVEKISARTIIVNDPVRKADDTHAQKASPFAMSHLELRQRLSPRPRLHLRAEERRRPGEGHEREERHGDVVLHEEVPEEEGRQGVAHRAEHEREGLHGHRSSCSRERLIAAHHRAIGGRQSPTHKQEGMN